MYLKAVVLYRLAQTLIISQACHYGLADCVTEAKELFADWMKNANTNP